MRELIKSRLAEVRLSMSQASLKIGRNASYLQQFISRGIPEELHENERLKLAELLGIEENALRGKSAPLMTRVYNKQPNGTRSQMPYDNSVTNGERKTLDTSRIYPITSGVPDLPVYASVQRTDGATVMSSTPIDRIARPNFLAHVVNAYGLIIIDDAMAPEAKTGSMVLVHPYLPPRDDDTCLFYSGEQSNGTPYVMGILVRQTEKIWVVHQHKSRKEFELKKSEWPVCRRVVGNYNP